MITKEQFTSGIVFIKNNTHSPLNCKYRFVKSDRETEGYAGSLQEIVGQNGHRTEYGGNIEKITKTRFLAYTSIAGKCVKIWLRFSDYTAVNDL